MPMPPNNQTTEAAVNPDRSVRGVVVVIADDWSPIAGAYGCDEVHTPAIDALAEQSTVFHQAFCTTPSCAASRANLLTGQYSHTHGQYGHCHGVHGFQTLDHVSTLPARLKDAGVRSGLFGKKHVAPPAAYPFDVCDQSEPWRIGPIADHARRFLQACDGQPFYLHLASTYPHRRGATFDPSIGDASLHETDVTYDPDALTLPGFLPDTPEVRDDFAAYYRFISRFDRFVGEMLDVLDASGRANDTMVVLMSDHGMPFPGAKGSSFDTGHRCPLIIRDPRRPHRRDCDRLVNWSNLTPTVLDWLGINPEPQLPEPSLMPLLDRPDAEGFDRVFFSHSFHEITNYQPYRAIRTDRYKLVQNLAWQLPGEVALPSDLFASPTWQAVRHRRLTHTGQRPVASLLRRQPEELFDIRDDPWEARNLCDDPGMADTLSTLRQRLTEFRQRTRDPWLQADHQLDRRAEPWIRT